ncbi:MAG: hypothetical protein ACK4GG_07145 [Sphingomonas sp.]
MRRSILIPMLMGLTSCGPAPFALDPNDDYHCAIIFLTLDRATDRQSVDAKFLKATHTLKTWYFSRMSEEEFAASNQGIESINAEVRRDPTIVASIAKACATRADKNPEFRRFAASAMK